MDPEACFLAFCGAVTDGELDLAADAQESYSEWIAKGGFPARDRDDAIVLKLDTEQDRYLVDDDGKQAWRRAWGR